MGSRKYFYIENFIFNYEADIPEVIPKKKNNIRLGFIANRLFNFKFLFTSSAPLGFFIKYKNEIYSYLLYKIYSYLLYKIYDSSRLSITPIMVYLKANSEKLRILIDYIGEKQGCIVGLIDLLGNAI